MAVSLGITITENSQSVANNKTNVTVSVYCWWSYGSYNLNESPSPAGRLNIDGTYYHFNNTFNDGRTANGSKTLFTKTLDVAHDNEGKKTIMCSAQYATGVSSGTISASASKKLTDIPRFATIKSAPNFNDEENPTITYSNPAGNSVTSLRACISLDGSNADIEYRDISKTGTSYTFNLTDAERDVLRAATTGANSRTVKFYVRSEIGGNYQGSNIARTFTIKNPNPTINPTITDSNSTTVALTGNSSKLVKYYSNAAITIGATAVKKATLKSQKVTCGNKSLTANGTINAVESGSFVFTATDSRGNTTEKEVTPTFIDYIKLTCSLGNNMPLADGTMAVRVSGNYFNGSFGAKSNSLNVYYRYKTVGGSYSSWVAMTVTKSGNTYSATANLTGLDYQTAYVFQAYAKDELATVYSAEKTGKATPIFDYGKNDFKFNVPVYDKFNTLFGNGLAAYTGGGDAGIDPNTTLEELCLTSHSNAPQGLGTFYFIHTAFYNTKSTSSARAQVAFPYNKLGPMYHRYYASGAWSVWQSSALSSYPVGSYYISANATSPASLFGGTWHRIESRFLWAAPASSTLGATGGEQTHTLTANEMPSHTHNIEYAASGGYKSGKMSIPGYAAADNVATYGSINSVVATGGGAAHNNMPPYVNVAIWRREA